MPYDLPQSSKPYYFYLLIELRTRYQLRTVHKPCVCYVTNPRGIFILEPKYHSLLPAYLEISYSLLPGLFHNIFCHSLGVVICPAKWNYHLSLRSCFVPKSLSFLMIGSRFPGCSASWSSLSPRTSQVTI